VLDFPFAGSDRDFDAACVEAREVLADFARVASQQTGLAPLPTIADSGSEERRRHPGGGRGLSLDPERWSLLTRRVERVAEEVRDLGLEPTFHHHAATYVETPDEISRLLEDTTIGLTLDTGHLVLGGGDPIEALDQWRGRVNHVHLKDVDRSVLVAAGGSDDPVRDIWEKRVFVALDEGDVDVAGFMDRLMALGYEGWVVVEQDVVLMDVADVHRAIDDQHVNRDRLRRWIP
jgi:Sugar phosphate isomerases/epimerases